MGQAEAVTIRSHHRAIDVVNTKQSGGSCPRGGRYPRFGTPPSSSKSSKLMATLRLGSWKVIKERKMIDVLRVLMAK